MDTEEVKLFESVPVKRAVLTLAVPTVLSQLITVAYNMADTFFIGQLGDPTQVAAATLGVPTMLLLTALANMFGLGGAGTISRCLGVKNHDRAKHCAAFCIWTAIAVSFLYGLLVYALRDTLLPVLGANSGTYEHSCTYIFWTITVGAVPTVMNSTLAHLVRSEGYSRQAGLGIAFGGVLNIALDPLFIFVFKLEIAGAAMATMLSNTAAMLYFFIFLYRIRKKTTITPNPRWYSARTRILPEVVTCGLPSFIMTVMGSISNTTLNHLVSTYSNEAVAGMGIAKKLDLVAFGIAQGMTQGVLPLIAYNYASGDKKRMNDSIRTSLLYSLGVAVVGGLLLFFCATPIVSVFIDNPETVAHGQSFLRIISIACPTTALNFMIITVFQATKCRVQPIVLSLLRKGTLDVPLMLLFSSLLGVDGIAWATPLADALALLAALCLFIPYMRKHRV